MKIQDGILAVLFISIIIIGATTYMGALQSDNSATADFSELNNTKVKIQEQQEISSRTYDRFRNITLKEDIKDNVFFQAYELTQVGWESIRQFLNSFSTLFAIFEDVSNILNLPDWFVGTIVVMVMVGVVAMLIYLAFKWKVEDR